MAAAVVLVATALALNTVGLFAWRRGLLPRWWHPAVGFSALALLVGSDFFLPLALIGGAALIALTAVAVRAWLRRGSATPTPRADVPSNDK